MMYIFQWYLVYYETHFLFWQGDKEVGGGQKWSVNCECFVCRRKVGVRKEVESGDRGSVV